MCLSFIVLHITSPNPQIQIRCHNNIETTDFKTSPLWSSSGPQNLPYYGLKLPASSGPYRKSVYKIRQFRYAAQHTEKPEFTMFAKLRFNLRKNVSYWESFAAKYWTLDKLYDYLLYIVRNLCIKLPLHVMEVFFSNVYEI